MEPIAVSETMTYTDQKDTMAMKEQFTQLIQENQYAMYRLAVSILKNEADAEDAVSEAILNAYSHFSGLRDGNRFKAWVMKITANQCYNMLKKQKRLEYHDQMEAFAQTEEFRIDELWQVVQSLNDEYRTVIVLFYYDDLPIEEIAGILSIPSGTVKSRLAWGRNKLRQMLTEGGESYESAERGI